VWLKYQYGTNIEFHVDKAVAVRLLYFGTACGKDGIIQASKLISAKLDMDKNQKTAFLKQTLQAGILRRDGSSYFIDPQIISQGEYDNDADHIRVFSAYYRKLCESAHSQADLNRIYYFLQMIPYLNRQTNILSYNQVEQEFDCIAYMSFNDFCGKIDTSTAHSARLKKQLSTFRVNDELLIGFFNSISELTPNGKNVILNPKLFFGGDRTTERYKELCALFENEKNAYLALQERGSSAYDTMSSE
jgi:hypothetical protein